MPPRAIDPLLPDHLFAPPPLSDSDYYDADPFDLSRFDDPEEAGIVQQALADALAGVLTALNAEQHQAVETTENPLTILAGPGTGKTKMMTSRAAYIHLKNLCRPQEILMVTFTNTAAKEMRERLTTLIGDNAQNMWINTFHAFGYRFLRYHAELAGLKNSNFKILDEKDQITLLTEAFVAAGELPEKPTRDEAKALRDMITKAKLEIASAKDESLFPNSATIAQYVSPENIPIWAAYDQMLLDRNAVDFEDLIRLPNMLMQEHEHVHERWKARFRYIMVDEAQDMNGGQYKMVCLLAADHNNLALVGDLKQGIYAWRGANSRYLLDFPKTMRGCKTVSLVQNYRSTQEILDAASSLIAKNTHIPFQALKGQTRGPAPTLFEAANEYSEGEHIVALIKHHQLHGTSLGQMAILVRTKFQFGPVERSLRQAEIPYTIFGGARFYDREEIADTIAFLRLVIDAHDDLAFQRIANKPSRDIGPAAMRTIMDQMKQSREDALSAALTAAHTGQLRQKPAAGVAEFVDIVNLALATHLDGAKPSALIDIYLKQGKYDAYMRAEHDDYDDRLAYLEELKYSADDFERLQDFMAHSALMSRADIKKSPQTIHLRTMHSAKGAEFDIVFMPGMEDGKLPNATACKSPGGVEEERNLTFVGLTRARRQVHCSYALMRHDKLYEPSPFLAEAKITLTPQARLPSTDYASSNRIRDHVANLAARAHA